MWHKPKKGKKGRKGKYTQFLGSDRRYSDPASDDLDSCVGLHGDHMESLAEKVVCNPDLMETLLAVGQFDLIDLVRMKLVCTLWRALIDKTLTHIDYTRQPNVNVLDEKVRDGTPLLHTLNSVLSR